MTTTVVTSMRYANIITLGFANIIAMYSTTAFAAGFDCNKAKSYVERSICKNKKLSVLDDQLNALYQAEVTRIRRQYASNAPSKKHANWAIHDAKKTQKNWLTYQRNTCTSVACIGREYEQRIDELIKLSNDKKLTRVQRTLYGHVPEKNPRAFAFGQFIYKHNISTYDRSQPNNELIGSTKDALIILPIPKKPKLAIIDIDVTGGNAHKCTLNDAKFTWRENHWSLFRTESFGKDSNMAVIKCQMRIYPTKQAVFIKDINGQCKRLNCGVRAGFDGAVFKRSR